MSLERPMGHTSGSAGTVLVSYGDMAYSDKWGYWRGEFTGDVRGKTEFRESPKNFNKDGKEYYFETFVIDGPEGTLRGTKDGVYDLTTGEFWDHGPVTEATGHLSHLRGYLIFERASTTTPGVFPMLGHRTPALFLPPQPSAGRGDRILVCRTGTVLDGPRRGWHGPVTGDLQGEADFWEQAKTYSIGDTEYFSEAFVVTGRNGSLRGTDAGIWNRATGYFWAYGFVSEALGAWARTLGSHVVRWGSSSFARNSIAPDERVRFIVVPVHAD